MDAAEMIFSFLCLLTVGILGSVLIELHDKTGGDDDDV